MFTLVFTLEKINDAHDRVEKMEDFPKYVKELYSLGVETYDTYIRDGHSEYFGKDGFKLASPAIHEEIAIEDISDKEELQSQLEFHKQHTTDYMQMSRGLAGSGIEKWVVDTSKMTIAYCDKSGKEIVMQDIR